uniref:Tail protein n=1 Tax=Myoviridae sp. ctBvM24 TaxID=2825050 RepID=A0A8S5UD51_9CAUD|nr:MAG TPA: tail protein [Myoviridae sp. ctBvM24]
MQIFNDKKERVGILKGFKDRKIVSTLSSGDKELTFKYPAEGEMVAVLKEEYYIRTKTDEYVLRAKKTGEQYNEYTAQLNVEELEGTVFPYGFESKEQTIRSCLEFAFEGTGWKVGECTITKKRTIDSDEETTAWDVLQDCLSTYRAECKINTLTKTVDIYEQIGSDRGRYFIEGLNLKKLTVSSDTYDFYTRLIPMGKDGIGIDWLGKPYLENYQYSSKIKTYVWSDERYTNTTSLIEDGTAKLDEMSKPYVVYAADVIDLARQSKKYSNVLDFEIGDTCWMISRKTRTKEKQRIVKLTEYPENPKNNTVELSNTSKTFAEVQQEATDKAKTEAIQVAKNSQKKTLEDNYYTKSEVQSAITATAESIDLSVSKTYETKTVVEEKINSVNELTDEKLTLYSTTEEMNAAIKTTAESIDLSVSKTYETKTVVEEKINSVTELTNASIKELSDSITLEVGKKVTKDDLIEEINSQMKISTTKIEFSTGDFIINAKNFSVDEDGNAEYSGNVKGKTITIESTDKTYTEQSATATGFTVDGSSALISQYFDDQSGAAGSVYYTNVKCGTRSNSDETYAEAVMEATEYRVTHDDNGNKNEVVWAKTVLRVDPTGAYIDDKEIIPMKLVKYDDGTQRTLSAFQGVDAGTSFFPDPDIYGYENVECIGGHPNGTVAVKVQGNGWLYNMSQSASTAKSITWYLLYY